MQRTVFNEEHEDFRKVIRSFIEAEVVPNFSDWEREGMVPRDFYRQLRQARRSRNDGSRAVRRSG